MFKKIMVFALAAVGVCSLVQKSIANDTAKNEENEIQFNANKSTKLEFPGGGIGSPWISTYDPVTGGGNGDGLSYYYFNEQEWNEYNQENNNNIFGAQFLKSGDNGYIGASEGPKDFVYNVEGKISATNDVDLYCFALYGNAKLEIEFNWSKINEKTGNYSNLFRFQVGTHVENYDDVNFFYRSWSNSRIQTYESPSGTPQLYFVEVYSESGFDNINKYSLKIKASYKKKENAKVSTLKAKNYTGAAWVSDYDCPFGIGCYDCYKREPLNSSFTNTDVYNKFFEFLHSKSRIKCASYYIWDASVKEKLYQGLSSIMDDINLLHEKLVGLRNHCDISDITVIIGRVLSGINLIVRVGAAIVTGGASECVFGPLSVGLLGLNTLLGIADSQMVPRYFINDSIKYIEYLRKAKELLEVDRNQQYSKIFKMDLWYSVKTDGGIGNSEDLPINYIDFSKQTTDVSLCNISTITAFQTSSGYFNGTIYPMDSEGKILLD